MHHILFEFKNIEVLEKVDVEQFKDSKNLILFLNEEIKKEKLEQLEKCESIDYIICTSEPFSKKIIKAEGWINEWIEECSKKSMESYFFSDEESGILKKLYTKMMKKVFSVLVLNCMN